MSELELCHVGKIYENHVVEVKDFNLIVSGKEFIVLIGSSGCGKSITLLMIAGLEEIFEGKLLIDGKCVNKIESKVRDVSMVFQNYALCIHMTIYENLAFPLKIRKVPKNIIENKVQKAAKLLGLDSCLYRKPEEISFPVTVSENACNYDEKKVIFGFRAEAVSIQENEEIECVVDVIERMGAENSIYLKAGNHQFVMKVSGFVK